MTTTKAFPTTETVRFGAVSPPPVFPNFSDKHAHESIISPGQMMSDAISNDPRLRIPDAVVLTYAPWLLTALDRYESTVVEGYPGPLRTLRIVETERGHVGVAGNFGVGAPVAA